MDVVDRKPETTVINGGKFLVGVSIFRQSPSSQVDDKSPLTHHRPANEIVPIRYEILKTRPQDSIRTEQ